MKKPEFKTLLIITISFTAILVLCDYPPYSNDKVKHTVMPIVEAASSANIKSEDKQYIPKNLDYSAMIKDIKAQEGIIETEEENKELNKIVATEDKTIKTSAAPSEYMNIAIGFVKEAMLTTDEAEKRTKVLNAYKFYKEYLKHYPGNIEALLGAGTMAIFLGKEEEAKNILMEAYATYPANPRVHKALGDYSFKFANFNNAIEYYNLSLSSGNLEDYATNLATAVCYEKLGDIEKAITYYKVSLHLNPNSTLAKQRVEMYAVMEQDGYEADTRKYENATKLQENEDMELQDLILDSYQIR
ncbi:MAG: tetratricopeptide repeat protein [Candidatus Gastranaerophilaceae bacterium]